MDAGFRLSLFWGSPTKETIEGTIYKMGLSRPSLEKILAGG